MTKAQILKRVLSPLLLLLIVFSLTACGNESDGTSSDAGDSVNSAEATERLSNDSNSEPQDVEPVFSGTEESGDDASFGRHILVAYFSRIGENYNVGIIEKGNTHIIADMIAEETGAEMFQITTVNPYPDTYDECTDVAKQEQNDNVRPEIVNLPENLDQYDTVFLGFPIWWGDMPMAVYTFLEYYDFSGKTIIPFCTHEGSGLSGTAGRIEDTCPGVDVLDGLAIRGSVAQNEQDKAENDVQAWLEGLDLEGEKQ